MMWDVGFGRPLRSLVDSGFYPETAQKAIQLGEQVQWLLGLTDPIRVCANREEAEQVLRTAQGDTLVVWPFDWDEVSW